MRWRARWVRAPWKRAVPKPDSAKGDPRTARWELLVEAGLIDQEFYEARVGRTFAGVRAAAKHLVRTSMAEGISGHPLLDISYLPPRQQENWRSRRVSRVLTFLSHEKGLSRPWSALFDPRAVLAAEGDPSSEHEPWQQLTGYLRALEPETVLPSIDRFSRHVTWGEARQRLIRAAREVESYSRLHGPRTTREWDESAEKRWLDEVDAADVPSADGPLVSVVMPVWNRAERVIDAIRSVQAQTLQQWELIVVDDGSSDHTLDVLRAAAAKDPRVVVVAEPHAGVCAARNAGLARGRGRYIAFLDSDNAWRPHYLDTMIRAMTRDGLSAAYSGAALHNRQRVLYRVYEGGLADLLVRNHIDINVFVLAADLAARVGEFDRTLRRWVDHDYVIRAARLVEPRFLPFIGCDYANERTHGRISSTESSQWAFPVLAKAWLDWDEADRTLGRRVAGRTSVVLSTHDDVERTSAAVEAILRTTLNADLEVVVLDNGSPGAAALALEAELVGVERVRLVRLSQRFSQSIAANLGIHHSLGEFVMFLPHDGLVRSGWLAPLAARLEDPRVLGVQSLLLDEVGTVASAGVAFPARQALPAVLLTGHPVEDANPLVGAALSAITEGALFRAEDLVALRGFDPLFVGHLRFVDLCLRAAEHRPGHCAVVADSVVDLPAADGPTRSTTEDRRLFLGRWRGRLPAAEHKLYAELGFDIALLGLDRQPFAGPRPGLVRRVGGPTRWSIKAPADPGAHPRQADDLRGCEELADALRAHGQEVVVMRRGAHDGPASALDDVLLAVRTDSHVGAQPGRVNVLLLSSDAGEVPVEERGMFDLVLESTQLGADAHERAGALVAAVSSLPIDDTLEQRRMR